MTFFYFSVDEFNDYAEIDEGDYATPMGRKYTICIMSHCSKLLSFFYKKIHFCCMYRMSYCPKLPSLFSQRDLNTLFFEPHHTLLFYLSDLMPCSVFICFFD